VEFGEAKIAKDVTNRTQRSSKESSSDAEAEGCWPEGSNNAEAQGRRKKGGDHAEAASRSAQGDSDTNGENALEGLLKANS
jgi:hypothetical protein